MSEILKNCDKFKNLKSRTLYINIKCSGNVNNSRFLKIIFLIISFILYSFKIKDN